MYTFDSFKEMSLKNKEDLWNEHVSESSRQGCWSESAWDCSRSDEIYWLRNQASDKEIFDDIIEGYEESIYYSIKTRIPYSVMMKYATKDEKDALKEIKENKIVEAI